MARLTLRLPDELYQRLCAAAKRKDVSLNQAILDTLDRTLPPTPTPAPEKNTEENRERPRIREWILASDESDGSDSLPPRLRAENAPEDIEAFLASIPQGGKSAAEMISEERDSYGY